MSILERIRRIVRANVNELLETGESPQQKIEAKVDDLQHAVGEARRALAGFAVTNRRLEHERQGLEKRRQHTRLEATRSLQSGDDQRAREQVAERVALSTRLERLIPIIEKSAMAHREMENHLSALDEQLRAARARLAELRSRKLAAGAQEEAGALLDRVRGVHAAGDHLTSLEEGIREAETDAEIQEEIRAELGDMHPVVEPPSASRIDNELDALRHAMSGRGATERGPIQHGDDNVDSN